jgi:disease resistance protein RPM1
MTGIDKLFQLKYLSFRGTDMLKLPSGISRLYGLETLDIRCTRTEELPSEIAQLIKLQHLLASSGYYESSGITKIPNGIGNMRNLRVISGFNVIKSSFNAVEELGNLTALEQLYLQLDG